MRLVLETDQTGVLEYENETWRVIKIPFGMGNHQIGCFQNMISYVLPRVHGAAKIRSMCCCQLIDESAAAVHF